MITTPLELRAALHNLTVASWSLAAIGFLFESGIADQLAQPRTVDELAAACSAVPASRIEKVLGVAAAHGVVVVADGRYRLADGAMPVIGPMRAAIVGDIRSHVMQPLALLDAARAGTSTAGWAHTDPVLLNAQGDASSIMPAMLKNAPPLAELAARLDRPGATFLDVGTGVGALAISACRMFPQVRVVGLDTSDAPLALARTNIAKAGLADRIELRKLAVQDLRDESTFTCAWLPAFFIPPPSLPAAIARVAASLEPGGVMMIGSPGSGDTAQHRAVWELVGDLWGGQTPSAATIESLLRDAGLREIRAMPGPAWAPQMFTAQRV